MPTRLDHHRVDWPAAAGVDEHGVGILDEDTCFRLLGDCSVGRLGISDGALPAIMPVNYVLRQRDILFESADGAKLRAARRADVACLQIDDVDLVDHRGWSVLATGRLQLVDPDEIIAMGDLRLMPWALRGELQLVRLRVELISGRVIGIA